MALTDARGINRDFRIDRGERVILEATITNADTGNAINLTGHTVEFIIESTLGGTNVLKTTNTNHSDAVNGKTQFTVSSAITITASATVGTKWHYAVHWKDDSDPVKEDIHSWGYIYVYPVAVEAFA